MDSAQSYTEPLGDTWKYDPDYHRVSEFLGINRYDREDEHLAKKVSAIREWTEGKDTTEALWKIDGLRKKLGHQFIGKPLVQELYQHIRLMQDSKQSRVAKEHTRPQVKQEAKAQAKPSNDLQQRISSSVEQTVSSSVRKSVETQVSGMIRNSVQASIAKTVEAVASDKKFISQTIQGVLKDTIK